MPIEIREIVIKTEIRNDLSHEDDQINTKNIQELKSQLRAECKKMILDHAKKKKHKR